MVWKIWDAVIDSKRHKKKERKKEIDLPVKHEIQKIKCTLILPFILFGFQNMKYTVCDTEMSLLYPNSAMQVFDILKSPSDRRLSRITHLNTKFIVICPWSPVTGQQS